MNKTYLLKQLRLIIRTYSLYNSKMANKKIIKIPFNILYVSIFVNILAIAIIIYLFWKRRSLQTKTSQTMNALIQQSKRSQKTEANKKIQVIQNYREQLKSIPIQSSQLDMQLLDKKIFQFHQITQQADRSDPQQQQIKLLRQQIQLQRERNQLLEQKQVKLQEKLMKLLDSKDKVFPEDYQNIKNQLQFCQERLNQATQTQLQLKQKLADYQRLSISMLNHPEYQRLRQLNNKYKDTIAKLQSHLLSRHESKDQYFDLSFHNL